MGRLVLASEFIDTACMSNEEAILRIKKFYRMESKKIVDERSKYYSNLLKAKPKSIKIVETSKRWGSCDQNKNITYNYQISSLSIELIDYIVVHELCHLLHMNHDRSFYRKIGSVLKDYKEREKALSEIGLANI